MPKHVNQLGAALAVALAPGLLAACAGDVINLGEREDEVAVPAYSRCQSSTTLEGSVRVESQEQLDALEGCKVIAGDFDVVAYPAADLRALNALTRVEGYVQIGGHLPVRDENDGLTLEEWWAQHDAYEASIVDWLPSLEGLERLESVDSLIVKASVPSLQPLSGLRRINTGLLQVSSNVLESLAGLEHLRGIESLSIDGAELRDVSALRLPETMGSLLVHAPIDALDAAELKQLLSLDLAYTELENLDVFSSLENVDRVSIVGNARLRDMAGFDGVNTIGDLFLQGNAALERMGDFASLTSIGRVQIADNDSLSELPRLPNYYQQDELLSGDGRPRIDVDEVELRGNASLRHLVIPAVWYTANTLRIIDTQVDTIDFVNLQSVGTLIVTSNPALTEVNLGALSRAAYLEVRKNDALPPTAFDGVRSLETHIERNAPPP
ncbi:MAG TPA: hypothetical protein VMG12_43675 [Polyangiaceae bacterium]|nr:hypothetical protein [Polyangiaceae bacterium]